MAKIKVWIRGSTKALPEQRGWVAQAVRKCHDQDDIIACTDDYGISRLVVESCFEAGVPFVTFGRGDQARNWKKLTVANKEFESVENLAEYKKIDVSDDQELDKYIARWADKGLFLWHGYYEKNSTSVAAYNYMKSLKGKKAFRINFALGTPDEEIKKHQWQKGRSAEE